MHIKKRKKDDLMDHEIKKVKEEKEKRRRSFQLPLT